MTTCKRITIFPHPRDYPRKAEHDVALRRLGDAIDRWHRVELYGGSSVDEKYTAHREVTEARASLDAISNDYGAWARENTYTQTYPWTLDDEEWVNEQIDARYIPNI